MTRFRFAFLAVLFSLICFSLGRAQEAKALKIIDEHALKAPADAEGALDDLAQYLVQPCKSNRDKARAIYRWITDRIAYDAESFFSKKFGDNSPEGVLRSRKAVCAGYANLFAALGKRAGLEVAIVGGFAKGVGFDGADVKESNHAWNAIKLDGEWRLIDSTWGAGYLNGTSFVKRFADFYFLIAPEKLIFSHLPTNPKWQLVSSPLDAEQFRELPKVDRALWELGVSGETVRKAMTAKSFQELVKVYSFPGNSTTLINAPLAKQLKAGTKYTFEFKSDDFVEMAGFQDKRPTPLFKKGNVFRGVLTPRSGDFRIVGRTKNDVKRYAGILEYVVE